MERASGAVTQREAPLAAHPGRWADATSPMVTEQEIREKLRKIEALFAGAATPGERDAAEAARERIQQRLRDYERTQRPEEWRFSLENPWSRKLFIALARRYGLSPYRRPCRGDHREFTVA